MSLARPWSAGAYNAKIMFCIEEGLATQDYVVWVLVKPKPVTLLI